MCRPLLLLLLLLLVRITITTIITSLVLELADGVVEE